jgi:uncharacterized surface protein with fasciclin (FAS1) repeats
MKYIVLSLTFVLSIFGLAACSSNTEPPPTKTIAELVTEDPQFSALLETATDAGLLETLQGAGPFTVFAPTNTAFATLPTSPETLEDLKQLLLYHVVAEKLEAKDITSKPSGTLKSAQGLDLSYTVTGNEVILTDSRGNKVKVIKTDIQATNGVIHVIESVLLLPNIPAIPPAEMNR